MSNEESIVETPLPLPSFTSIGGYPIAYLIESETYWGVLCASCCSAHDEREAHVSFINDENPSLYCDECGTRIESAYAEEEYDGPCAAACAYEEWAMYGD